MTSRRRESGDPIDREIRKIKADEAPSDYFETLWPNLKRRINEEKREKHSRPLYSFKTVGWIATSVAVLVLVTVLVIRQSFQRTPGKQLENITINKKAEPERRVVKAVRNEIRASAVVTLKETAEVMPMGGDSGDMITTIGYLDNDEQDALIALLNEKIAESDKAENYEM